MTSGLMVHYVCIGSRALLYKCCSLVISNPQIALTPNRQLSPVSFAPSHATNASLRASSGFSGASSSVGAENWSIGNIYGGPESEKERIIGDLRVVGVGLPSAVWPLDGLFI